MQRLGIGKVYYYDLGNEITTTIIQEDDEGNISKKEYKDSSIPATGLKDRIIFDVNIPEKLFEENGILCFYQYHSEIKTQDFEDCDNDLLIIYIMAQLSRQKSKIFIMN